MLRCLRTYSERRPGRQDGRWAPSAFTDGRGALSAYSGLTRDIEGECIRVLRLGPGGSFPGRAAREGRV
jgi:hypothetical protein